MEGDEGGEVKKNREAGSEEGEEEIGKEERGG